MCSLNATCDGGSCQSNCAAVTGAGDDTRLMFWVNCSFKHTDFALHPLRCVFLHSQTRNSSFDLRLQTASVWVSSWQHTRFSLIYIFICIYLQNIFVQIHLIKIKTESVTAQQLTQCFSVRSGFMSSSKCPRMQQKPEEERVERQPDHPPITSGDSSDCQEE